MSILYQKTIYLSMISLNAHKTLNIILANTNKALSEVLKSVSPQELETLTKSKDLNSIVEGLLKRSLQNPSQDKTLLSLVKSNPTLKELGSVTTTIKELLNTLKKEENPLPLEKKLSSFLTSVKDMSEKNLQSKIENSGLFLENKLKNIQSPQLVLKESLQELTKQLQTTKLPNVQTILSDLKTLLNSEVFKSISKDISQLINKPDLAALTELTKKTQPLLNKLQERLNSSVDKTIAPKDTLFSKDTKQLLERLTLLNKPEQLIKQTQIKETLSQDFKAVLLKAQEELQTSASPNRQELLKQVDKLLLQIDYQQLLSHLSNATSLYLPYEWDMLEDGNITLKNAKDGKFFTDIELQLKEFGLLKLRLGMFEQNQLNVNITTQSPKLKKLLQENISSLKKQLIDVGVMPMSIRFLDDANSLSSAYSSDNESINAGFEVKA